MNHPTNSPNSQPQPQELLATAERVAAPYPETFKNSSLWAAAAIAALDEDPVTAMEDDNIRTTVDRIARMGMVTDYYYGIARPNRLANAEDCRASLPAWLQPEFLAQQGIRQLPVDRPPYDLCAIDAGYKKLLAQLGFELKTKNWNGEYYGSSAASPPTARATLWYKTYIEHHPLQTLLESGELYGAMRSLGELGLEPYRIKLHDDDSLVWYFHSSISEARRVEGLLRTRGIPYRGPAQDVLNIVIAGSDTPHLQVQESNDNALADMPTGWSRYSPHPYDPTEFLEAYLRQCAKWGKSPADPYRTSFVTLRLNSADWRLGEAAALRDEVANVAWAYPIVIRPYPKVPIGFSLSRL